MLHAGQCSLEAEGRAAGTVHPALSEDRVEEWPVAGDADDRPHGLLASAEVLAGCACKVVEEVPALVSGERSRP